jgi:hypothetical protein
MRLFSDRQPRACATSSPSTSCPQVQCHAWDIVVKLRTPIGPHPPREADGGIVLKRLIIEAEGGHDWQRVEPFAARVGGQAVEESVVTCAGPERKQLLRVCSMKGTSHGTRGVAEVLRMMLCKRGDLGRENGWVADTQVSPGVACGAMGGRKGAQTWGGSLQSSFSARAAGNEGRCA